MPKGLTRRTMIQAAVAAAVPYGTLLPPRAGNGRRSAGHPTPRAGITAAKVLPAAQLEVGADVAAIFEQIREIPAVADGIRCQCSCADQPDYYSLLTCFEGAEAMALHCEICQAQGRLASRLHRTGKTLDQIRKAIDARFG